MSFKLNAISGTFVDAAAAAAAAPESFNSLNIYRFSGLRAQGKGKKEPVLAFPGKKRISLFFLLFFGIR